MKYPTVATVLASSLLPAATVGWSLSSLLSPSSWLSVEDGKGLVGAPLRRMVDMEDYTTYNMDMDNYMEMYPDDETEPPPDGDKDELTTTALADDPVLMSGLGIELDVDVPPEMAGYLPFGEPLGAETDAGAAPTPNPGFDSGSGSGMPDPNKDPVGYEYATTNTYYMGLDQQVQELNIFLSDSEADHQVALASEAAIFEEDTLDNYGPIDVLALLAISGDPLGLDLGTESDAPTLPLGASIEDVLAGSESAEVIDAMIEQTIVEDSYPEQEALLRETAEIAASGDPELIPGAPDDPPVPTEIVSNVVLAAEIAVVLTEQALDGGDLSEAEISAIRDEPVLVVDEGRVIEAAEARAPGAAAMAAQSLSDEGAPPPEEVQDGSGATIIGYEDAGATRPEGGAPDFLVGAIDPVAVENGTPAAAVSAVSAASVADPVTAADVLPEAEAGAGAEAGEAKAETKNESEAVPPSSTEAVIELVTSLPISEQVKDQEALFRTILVACETDPLRGRVELAASLTESVYDEEMEAVDSGSAEAPPAEDVAALLEAEALAADVSTSEVTDEDVQKAVQTLELTSEYAGPGPDHNDDQDEPNKLEPSIMDAEGLTPREEAMN